MKFSDLRCCPFCGGGTFYERRRVSGYMTYYMNFNNGEEDNTGMYDSLDYDGNGRVWCAVCDSYLGNIDTDKVAVKAERAYRKQEVSE